jgi:hypothetical protein
MLDLTSLTTFDALRTRPNLKRRIILAIEEDSATLYFWTGPDRYFDSKMFYGLIADVGTMSQKIDLYKKTYNTNKMSFRMINGVMGNDGTNEIRLSNYLSTSDYINRTAKVYIWFEGITALSDCLEIFRGVVQPLKSVSDLQLTFELEDAAFMSHTNIPTILINLDDYPGTPEQSLGNPLPLVYGESNLDGEMFGTLHECEWIGEDKICISDSALDSGNVLDLWIYDAQAKRFTKIDSSEYSLTYDDSGITTAQFSDLVGVVLWLYTFPNGVKNFPVVHYCIASGAEQEESGDRDLTTYTSILSTVANQAQENYAFYLEYGLEAEGDLHTGAGSGYVGVKGIDDGLGSSAFALAYVYFYNTDDSTGAGQNLVGLSSADDYTEADIGAQIDTGRGYNFNNLNDFCELRIAVDPKLSGSQSQIFRIWEIRLKLKYSINITPGRKIYARIKGRDFGSWIDAVGRTPATGQDDENDIIKNPAYVIEDILRRDLGVSGDDIDVDAFDVAATVVNNIELAFTLTGQNYSLKVIEAICQQGRLNYSISAQGLHKLIALKAGSYSTNDTLYKQDIIAGSFVINYSDVDEIINDVDLQYEYNPGSGEYQQLVNDADSSSKTAYNMTNKKIIRADKITDATAAADLADHFCGSSNGFWSLANISHPIHSRAVITFECLTFEYIHWEVGDIILMDTSIDDICRNGAVSWLNHQMMITEKKIEKGQILKFTMVHVDTTS